MKNYFAHVGVDTVVKSKCLSHNFANRDDNNCRREDDDDNTPLLPQRQIQITIIIIIGSLPLTRTRPHSHTGNIRRDRYP